MEIHPQELHKLPGHGWKHYLFEFLMLFLAVTLGFYAENIRETIKKKEEVKTNIKALEADLKADVAGFDHGIKTNELKCRMIDTLINLLHGDRSNTSEIYFLARAATATDEEFHVNEGTFDQMKSSGTLKLIRPESLLDSISDYYNNREGIEDENRLQLQGILDIKIGNAEVFDGLIFQQMYDSLGKDWETGHKFQFAKPIGNPPLVTNDAGKINNVMVRYHYFAAVSGINNQFAKDLKKEALNIIKLIDQEYNLE